MTDEEILFLEWAEWNDYDLDNFSTPQLDDLWDQFYAEEIQSEEQMIQSTY